MVVLFRSRGHLSCERIVVAREDERMPQRGEARNKIPVRSQ